MEQLNCEQLNKYKCREQSDGGGGGGGVRMYNGEGWGMKM